MVCRSSRNGCPFEASEFGKELTVVVRASDAESLVTVAGRVTIDTSTRLRSVVMAVLRRAGSSGVIVDLSGVAYLDTSGIATLLEGLKSARLHSTRLTVVGVQGQPRMLTELTELDRIFRASGSEVQLQ